ncbi:hypothetical protein R1flu_010927 [Riccia fluitans]|uniref:Expansin-like EG45 domain-containing protein n=1 Tax=Riccia fluitans TaxID=41844 RepID=A0ABD1Z750_9MARC
MRSKRGNLLSLLVLAAVFLGLSAVPSSAQQYEQTYGIYTTSQSSSCFGSDYSEWGPDRSLAVGVSPAIFKVGTNGSPDACGATMEVKCLSGPCNPGNPTLQVTVVDLCRSCDDPTIRLTLNAYKKLAFIDGDQVLLGYRLV